jgi:hypothetical protein
MSTEDRQNDADVGSRLVITQSTAYPIANFPIKIAIYFGLGLN